VNAKVLADKFEVSVRTIARDIETLSLAEIPITTIFGANGGYKILDSFKMNNQLVNGEDFGYILTALEGLNSGYTNKRVQKTFEKILHTSSNNNIDQKIFLDFSAMHEGNKIDEYINLLEHTIFAKKCVEFDYTNSSARTSKKLVEPIALTYKWYAWYLLGYCHDYQQYRWYKVIRIRNLNETSELFIKQHEAADVLMKRQEETDHNNYINLKLKCKLQIKVQVEEYLKGEILSEDKDYFILSLRVPENERMWFSLLLGFGESVEVMEPLSVQVQLKNIVKEIFNMYDKV
jgi:predicted DNA-binding transcriptional regulator YafY